MALATFRDLRVWQDAMKLAVAVYNLTAGFPKHELYGITQQMRRAAVSVPSNIAEGKGHRSNGDFCRFLFHAPGSLLELQTQLCIAQQLQYLSKDEAGAILELTSGVGRGLTGLINSLREDAA